MKALLGRPLLDYSIQPALACPRIDAVYVNSDDQGYLDLAASLGARTYRRPAELATDTAAMGPVVADFCRALAARGEQYQTPCTSCIPSIRSGRATSWRTWSTRSTRPAATDRSSA